MLEIAREGNAIRILFLGYHSTNSEFCPYPEFTTTGVVGVYPPGDYTLQVDLMYDSIFGYRTDTIGIVPFSVTQPAALPLPAPTNGVPGLIVLMLAMVGIAAGRIRGLAVSRPEQVLNDTRARLISRMTTTSPKDSPGSDHRERSVSASGVVTCAPPRRIGLGRKSCSGYWHFTLSP